MVKLLEELPEELRAGAYLAGEEVAWAGPLALQAVAACSDRELAILGGEVWLAERPAPTIPTPILYHWDAGAKGDQESWLAFVQKCRRMAEQYIGGFDWDPSDVAHRGATPYFNLTLCSEREYDTLAPG